MSIIKLEEPWCFNAMSLEQREVISLQKHFVNEDNHQDDWQNTDYCGITSDGLSEYFCSPEFFDEDDYKYNVTVYTIKQLRTIIAEHLAKQPVEKLEDGVVYYVKDKDSNSTWLVKNKSSYVKIVDKKLIVGYVSWTTADGRTYTKATPEQIAHYEACVKAGKYVEPESITQFVVGKWYKWFQKDHGREQKGKCVAVHDNHFAMKPWICNSSECLESGMFTLKDAESIEIIENLSEIQDLLPDGHPDKWVKTAPKSERYLETMKFFEQLREPERSEAIANYDEEYSMYIPKSLEQALSGGFCWDNTEQESDYWEDIHSKLLENTYFKEELLVFGKYKVGDIVVSLDLVLASRNKGEMFRVNEQSTENTLYYTSMTNTQDSKTWRPATPEEVEAYNQGVRNVADIKPKDYKEAVHCTTQEEWDFVLSKFNPSELTSENFKEEGSQSTITIKNTNDSFLGCYASVEYDVQQGFTILTFKQWCEKYGHSYEIVPEYVECVNSKTHHYKEGKIYTWPDTITEEGKPNKPDILKGGVWEFKPSTKEAYDEQQEKLKMEELLNEAKRRYPAGTKVRAVLDGPELTTEIFTLTDSHYWASGSKVPACYTEEGHPVCLHLSGKWAEIVKEEPKPTEIKPAKGMHVRCLKENNWSDGKTKVGQVFEIESVDWSGDMWVNNHSFVKERLERGEFELLPNYKEEPWIAQVGDWVYTLPDSSGWGMSVKDEEKIFKVKEITNNWCGETRIMLDGSSNPNKSSSTIDPVTLPNLVRKATQEEIDSVTMTAKAEAVGKVTVTGASNGDYSFAVDPIWTADNWYVEVSSQEEANAVIDAAVKMYDEPYDKIYEFDDEWKYVSLCYQEKKYSLLSRKFIHVASKPRPITDFIQPEIIRVPDEIDCINSRPLSPKECYKPQQDELFIYKPKQTRLVEPGAVSANVSTANLIIKSNSKYL